MSSLSIEQAYRPLANLLSQESSLGVTSGNDMEIITEGPRKLDLLLGDIEEAREYIHFQYYLFGDDISGRAVKEALMKKAREGVKVRILHENVANYDTKGRFYQEMVRAGVELIKVFKPGLNIFTLLPRINRRNHRKIVVIDGRIGYTGGMNIKDRYFTKWRDTHLRIIGPAVNQLQRIFLDGWQACGGKLDREDVYYYPSSFPKGIEEEGPQILRDQQIQVIPDGPYSKKHVLQQSYVWAISHARDYIWLQTPYFMPPKDIKTAMKEAVARGVDVRLMVPEESENFFIGPSVRSYYKECLKAGIKIYERGGGFIHSKTFVADDYLSSIGSANIDNRSFAINYEVNTYLYNREAAICNKEIFLRDLKISTEVTLETIKGYTFFQRLAQKFFRLFARQL